MSRFVIFILVMTLVSVLCTCTNIAKHKVPTEHQFNEHIRQENIILGRDRA